MSSRRPIIGITLGDINGIGPEIALAAATGTSAEPFRIALLGDSGIVDQICREQGHPPIAPWPLGTPYPKGERMACLHLPAGSRPLRRSPGRTAKSAALAAHHWILTAARMAMSGTLDAIVTAPIQKEGFMRAGLNVPGHTELLAQCAGMKHVEMILLNDQMRVVLCTRHIPLRDVARHLNRKRIQETIRYTADALAWLGIRSRRIAVCGLNPHAGDGGAIGDEEVRIIRPALRTLHLPCVDLTGPVPADTVFHQVLKGAYDAVVAMYHDQGLAPFKMIAFENGVNLTLGLPFVRTSPDHGTAYDLAGTGRANPSSMIAAIQLAGRLARRPNPWRAA